MLCYDRLFICDVREREREHSIDEMGPANEFEVWAGDSRFNGLSFCQANFKKYISTYPKVSI